jgi:hypothetical protein
MTLPRLLSFWYSIKD